MPNNATQLLLAYDDDRHPVLQLWDLRNSSYPLRETVSSHDGVYGHTRGIMNASLNPLDNRMLVSLFIQSFLQKPKQRIHERGGDWDEDLISSVTHSMSPDVFSALLSYRSRKPAVYQYLRFISACGSEWSCVYSVLCFLAFFLRASLTHEWTQRHV